MILARSLKLPTYKHINLIIMIAKKNSRYDLERKRIVFFQIGLFVTGAFTLAAFTYKTPVEIDNRKKDVAYQIVSMTEDAVKEIPKKEDAIQKNLPQPPSSSAPSVVAVITPPEVIDPSKSDKTDPLAVVIVGTGGLIIGDGDIINNGKVDIDIEPIKFPDVEAMYIGGYSEMVKYIKENIVFPQDAMDMNIQGKVYLSFVIEKDGSVSNVKVERGVFKSIDREATRIVRSFPTWIPGEVKAQKVRTSVSLPINFIFE